MPQLAEMAGELRAKEWQKGYYQLRTALNDLLGSGSPQAVLDGVVSMRKQFRARMEEATEFVEQATTELQEAAGRHEFSLMLKLTMELIRQKAIAQSSRAICDELGAVLKASGVPDVDRERRRGGEPSWLVGAGDESSGSTSGVNNSSAGKPGSAPQRRAESEFQEGEATYAKGANVVQLRRHSSFGKGKR